MSLPWLDPGDPFPDVARAWGPTEPAPGLLAAGGQLDVDTLLRAYRAGVFPWFGEGQPVLWWSPDPRMVLHVDEFVVHRSLRRSILRFATSAHCEIRVDSAFGQVMAACATSPRPGQSGTWIVPAMQRAYEALHAAGHAHSVETWIDGQLAGGLYCVAIGRAVFGESMFTRVPDASKLALAALVGLCRQHGITLIDCQQNTRHLASLGAREIARAGFVEQVARHVLRPPVPWRFEPVYWRHLLPSAVSV